MSNYYALVLPGYLPIRKQYRGVLNEKNLPTFPANTWVFQSMTTIVHFHYCLN